MNNKLPNKAQADASNREYLTTMEESLFPVTKDGKSGFINAKGEVVIDFEFDGASKFFDGLAQVEISGKVSFIDLKGNIKIEQISQDVSAFSEGKAIITIDDKKGYINTNGEIIIEPKYYNASDFENGIALVVEDMLSEAYFIDETGKVKLQGKDFYVSKFKEGLINCKENGNWGFIDINNNFIIPPIYQYAREFSEGKSAVSPYKTLQGKPNKKTLFGFINHQNEMIIPPVFEGADIKFSEGLCAVWNNGYGYIDTKGELVIPYDLALGEHFSEELAVFQPKGKNKNYGFIDKTGKIVIEPIFTAADNFENGLASVIVGKEYENYRYGYIDKKGNYVWEPTR